MYKRMTLRQRLLTFGCIATWICIAQSYILAYMGMETNADVTVAVITLFGGMYVAYVSADTMDHNSLNKYGGINHDF